MTSKIDNLLKEYDIDIKKLNNKEKKKTININKKIKEYI